MSNVFENAILGHVSGKPFSHKAVKEWLPVEDFVTAIEEISQWEVIQRHLFLTCKNWLQV